MTISISALQSLQHYMRQMITMEQINLSSEKGYLRFVGDLKVTFANEDVKEAKNFVSNSRARLARLVKTQKAVKQALREAYEMERIDRELFLYGDYDDSNYDGGEDSGEGGDYWFDSSYDDEEYS